MSVKGEDISAKMKQLCQLKTEDFSAKMKQQCQLKTEDISAKMKQQCQVSHAWEDFNSKSDSCLNIPSLVNIIIRQQTSSHKKSIRQHVSFENKHH